MVNPIPFSSTVNTVYDEHLPKLTLKVGPVFLGVIFFYSPLDGHLIKAFVSV